MSEIISTYTPTDGADNATFWLGLAAMLIGFGLAYWQSQRQVEAGEYSRKMLVSMLFFFTGLLGMGTAFFSYWSLERQGQVILYTDGIQVGGSTVYYKEIKRVFIKEDKTSTIFKPEQTVNHRFLVIEPKEGRTLVVSEMEYPIGEIIGKIKQVVQATAVPKPE